MKIVFSLVMMSIAAMAHPAAIHAGPPAAEFEAAFAQAGQAYDNGKFAEAEAGYTGIWKQGYVSPELFFNLGNACFKQNKIGLAVLHYRRAWCMNPRDPDVQANLQFAVQSSQALSPSPTLLNDLLTRLRIGEWICIALIGYWGAAGALGSLWLWRRRAFLWRRLVLVLGLVLVMALAGVGQWLSLRAKPEVVIIEAGQQALYAPLEGSTPHMALPEGSIVRQIGQSGPWIKVTAGKEEGWVHRSACRPVYPLKYAEN